MLLKLFIRLLTPTRILRNYLREAISITNLNIIPILAVNSIFSIIIFFTYFGLMFLVFNFFYERNAQNAVLGFSGIPIIAYFVCSLIRFYLSLVRKSKINITLFTITFKKYYSIVILLVFYYLLYVIYVKVAFEIGEVDGRMLRTQVILGVFVFIWLLVRLIFSPLFVIEKGYSARKAMKASFLLTSGRTIKSFSLIFSSIFIFLSGFFLGIGFLYTFSLVMVGYILSYDINLKNRFSRRKKLIHQAAIEVKQQLEDTGFFKTNSIPENPEKE
ncbi:MAG: hypothetical protein SFU98_18650 [Leptospiraceae bacterium]|nr:hypothetical protein [Leptospiraceae bacterium]